MTLQFNTLLADLRMWQYGPHSQLQQFNRTAAARTQLLTRPLSHDTNPASLFQNTKYNQQSIKIGCLNYCD